MDKLQHLKDKYPKPGPDDIVWKFPVPIGFELYTWLDKASDAEDLVKELEKVDPYYSYRWDGGAFSACFGNKCRILRVLR